MVHSCYICKITSDKDSAISFHRFPKNDFLKEKWIKSLGLQGAKVNTNSKICSKHFPADSFQIRETGRRDLKPSAMPIYRKTEYSDDSIVPEELLSRPPSSLMSKEENDSFTMFLADNLELFPDHLLKSDCLDASDIFLNESMEKELMDTESINLELSNFVKFNEPSVLKIKNTIFDTKCLSSDLSATYLNSSNESQIDINETANIDNQISSSNLPSEMEENGEIDVDGMLHKMTADNNFKWRAYFKQCTVADFATPEMARRNIELGKREIESHQKKIKVLQQQNRRLKGRVSRLKSLLKQCKQNNSIDLGNALEDDEFD